MKKRLLFVLAGFLLGVLGCSQDVSAPVQPAAEEAATTSMSTQVSELLDRHLLSEEQLWSIGQELQAEGEIPSLYDTSYDVYAVAYLWGQLFNASVPPAVTTDWSGTLSVNGEAIISVAATISFENGQDSLVPVSVPAQIAWVSYTDTDFDGLITLVFLKRGIIYVIPPTLTFATAPFTLELGFDSLDHYCAYYLVDSTNAVAVHARKLFGFDCPQGLLTGEWIRDDVGGESGEFHGLWLDEEGSPIGYFHGIFDTEPNGWRYFIGELSGYETDQVIASLSGTWYYDDPRLCPLCGTGHGFFSGRYYNLDGSGAGTLSGEFGDYSLPVEQNNLPLQGVWRAYCPAVSALAPTPAAH